MPEASQKAAMKLCDGKSETHPGAMQGDAPWQKQFEMLRRQFEQRWVAQTTKERGVIQSGIIEGKSFSIFDNGSIEIQTGSGIKQFKDYAELRAAWGRLWEECSAHLAPGSTVPPRMGEGYDTYSRVYPGGWGPNGQSAPTTDTIAGALPIGFSRSSTLGVRF